MSFLVTVGGALFVLFVVSYFRPGRFGAVSLGFGTGYLLSILWTDFAASRIQLSIAGLRVEDMVFAAFVLAPGLAMMLFRPRQKSIVPRILQAFLIGTLGVALLLPVLHIGGGHVSELYKILEENRDVVISVLLTLGLLDMAFSRPEKAEKPKGH